MDIVQAIKPDLEATSTWLLARELFSSSWKYNDGKTVDDVLLFDTLDEPSKNHLLDTAAAGEEMVQHFQHEQEDLLKYNTAATLYEAYTGHPYSATPQLGWEGAPTDVKCLWLNMAGDFLTLWREVKNKPRHKGWYDVELKHELG